jgi:hypothetical protein
MMKPTDPQPWRQEHYKDLDSYTGQTVSKAIHVSQYFT